ncbi:hypothetical protein [Dietzia aerolata]|uniref:Uncharacterized protein n=1 Tax=Dietzia aerolata TaxID=595984 RepID=A0ABV5JMJ1_9ACTN
MSFSLALQDREGLQPDPESPAAQESTAQDVSAQHNASHHDTVHEGIGAAATGTPEGPAPTAAVLPSPLRALGAAALGGLAGAVAIYLVSSHLAGTLAAVAAIIMIFAVAMAGPWFQARAETELGRMAAVAMQAVGFGGVLGALIILI